MTVVVNALNCKKGGIVQVAVGFIECSHKLLDTDFVYLISPEVYRRLVTVIDISKIQFHVLDYKPWSFFQIIGLNLRVNSILQSNYSYSISIGFPSLVVVLRNDVGRWTDPWNIYPRHQLPYNKLKFWYKSLLILLRPVKLLLVRRAKVLFTESAYVAEHIKNRLNCDTKVIVTPNFVNNFYLGRGLESNFKSNVLFVLMADHPHKDFEILVDTLKILKEHGHLFKIIISLDENSKRGKNLISRAADAGVETQLDLVGFVSVEDSVQYFKQSFLLLLPTHLEVFSVTPLEAGSFGIPSVVTDYEFNRSVYQDNVVYFNPYSSTMLADCIIRLKNHEREYLHFANRSKAMSNYGGDKIIQNLISDLNTLYG
jgi:glycosyltransferase involved in cell wall biosynthesis